ncbi:MAG TPA: ATP-binding protein [Actinomycetota bacterium]|nr:ATP-binding protein [Actinomycetota bacterium]
MAEVSLEIPPKSPYVGVVRLALSSLARTAGLDEEKIDDLKIAVSEACANAVLNNAEASSPEPVRVAWSEDAHAVRIEVGDRGPGVDPAAVDDVDTQGFSTRAVMSFALLKSLVDECHFESRAGGGMTTRLVIKH